MDHESVNEDNVTITTGYGQLCQVGASATLGATVEVNVDAQVKCLREEDIQTWLKQECQRLRSSDKDSSHKLETSLQAEMDNKNPIAAVSQMIGFSGKGKVGYDFNKKTQNGKIDVNNDNKVAVEKLKEISESNVRVTGKISVTGISMTPSHGDLYIKLSKIKFSDGTTKTIYAGKGLTVADKNGN